MRSYLVSDVVLCTIVIASLIIGILIGSLAGYNNKFGSENGSLIPPPGGASSNTEGKIGSLAAEKSKDLIKNITTNSSRTPETNISIFDQNDFKHIFSVDTYYKKSSYAFKEYYWTDITEILGGGFFNASKEPDCGEKAAFAEWLLRRYGINASIVAADKFPGINCSHAWVKVKTPLNETIFIDLSQSQANENDTGYIKIGDEYKHFDREFKDVFEAESSYSDSCTSCKHHFAWWETDWGMLKLKSLGFYDNETITVTGSAAIFPIVDAEVKAFNSQRNGCKVNLNGGSNSECIAAIAENTSDIALTSREVTNDEKKEYGDNFKQFNIGLDGRILVVSKSIYQAGIKELTTEQVRNIYTGMIRNWKELGGPDRQIYVMAGKMRRGFINNTTIENRNTEALGINIEAKNDTEVKTAIAGSDRAIGYLDYDNLGSENISAVAIDGIFPTLNNITDGSYKLHHPFIYLYIYVEPDPCVQRFMSFLNSSAGQNIIAIYDKYL